MPGDECAAQFADGLVEDLTSGICRRGDFNVACHASVLAISRRGTGVDEIASRLGVRYLLDGRLRRCGRRLRLNLQLIDTHGSCFVVWTSQFTRRMADSFELQDEICTQVIDALTRRFGEARAAAR